MEITEKLQLVSENIFVFWVL